MTATTTYQQKLWRAWRKAGDRRAFEALVRPELRYAADLARRSGAASAEAEDAVQRSLTLLAREKSDDPVRVGVRAWLCRRVVLGVRMEARAAGRRRRHERTVTPRGAVSDPSHRAELRDEVEKALSLLDGAERRVLVLRYLEDLDYAEIAYVLDTTENACRIRVHKALKRLRGRLGPKAAALVAAIGVPEIAGTGGLVAGAVKTGAGAGAVLKAAAVLIAAGATATTVAILPSKDTPKPTPVVAAAPAPTPTVEPPPAPPPPPLPLPAFASGLDLLDRHFAGTVDVGPALWDADAVARLVPAPGPRTTTIEATGETTDVNLWTLGRETDRLVLGPGRFRFVQPLTRGREAPFEIRGAGVDRTEIFVPNHDLVSVVDDARMAGFTIRDLTFDGSGPTSRRGGNLLDVRGTAVARIERVRFRRWPDKAGYGAPVGVAGPAGRALVLFRDCDFVGGYRRRPGGSAIAVRGGGLALLDDCRFYDLDDAVTGGRAEHVSPRSAVNLRDCRYVNTTVLDMRFVRTGRRLFPVRARGAEIALGGASLGEESRLERWGRARLEAAYDLRSGPAVIRGRVDDVAAVLGAVAVPAGLRVSAVQAISWEGAADAFFGILLSGDDGETVTRAVRRGRDGVTEVDPAEFPHLRFAEPDPVDPGPDLRDLLPRIRRSFGADAPIRSLAVTPGPGGGNVVLVKEDDRFVVVSLSILDLIPEPK